MQNCPYAPDNMQLRADILYKQVKARMFELMPGWFDYVNELMLPDEPDLSIRQITNIYLHNPTKNLDDIIHETMYDEWFYCHGDGEDF